MAVLPRVYHHINIHAQANGRWSYTDPPLATLPPDLRDIYGPDPGWPWFGFDLDQQELRIIAALSGDGPLLEVFANGYDIHTLNTCDIFGIPYPTNKANPHTAPEDAAWRKRYGWQGKEDRRRVFAKTYVYRLNYGGDPKTPVAGGKALGLTGNQTMQLGHAYLGAHPRLNRWRQGTIGHAATQGETRTFMGRRRRYLQGGDIRARQALDHPVQAGGQDIANTIVIQVKDEFGNNVYYVYGMHDSQNWGVRREAWEEVTAGIKQIVLQAWHIGDADMVIPGTWKQACDVCGTVGKLGGCPCLP